MAEKVLLSGNEAIARGVWEAGCRFGSGYPGTPSSEILPALTALGDCYTEWSVNEKCALEAAAGANLTGARCLVTMKHVGLNVAADPFFTLSYTGVHGGVLIIAADDPAMHSSQNEQDSRHFARAAKVLMLEPSDTQEAHDMAKLGLELSERFDTPVLLRVVTRLCHCDGVVEIGARVESAEPCAPQRDPDKYVMVPARARARRRFIVQRTADIRQYAEESGINRIEPGDSEIGIITAGIPYQYAREAAPEASFLKLATTWPLPEELIRTFAASVKRLYVIEELDQYLTDAVRALGIAVEPLPASLQLGELSPARVRAALAGEDALPAAQELPLRPPQLCAGCPHRGVFHILRKQKLYVTGDIGCYTLGTLPPLTALDTCLCMGGGVGQAHGIAQACGSDRQTVAVIGDSTFVHSGITGLVNIAYNRSPATILILDNGTTAMTGGQDHPGTGETLAGHPGGKLDLAALCRAVGINNVQEVDPQDLAATEAAIKTAVACDEPSVVIARRPCVLICSERGEPFCINEEKCVRCGACVRIGCPAISLQKRESDPAQPVIDEALCTGCTLCVQVCPKDAIEPAGEAL